MIRACRISIFISKELRKINGFALYFCQIFMYEADRHRAFPDGRGDPVHSAGANVTGGKDAGAAGFQEKGVAVLLPDLSEAVMGLEVTACFKKPFVILDDIRS